MGERRGSVVCQVSEPRHGFRAIRTCRCRQFVNISLLDTSSCGACPTKLLHASVGVVGMSCASPSTCNASPAVGVPAHFPIELLGCAETDPGSVSVGQRMCGLHACNSATPHAFPPAAHGEQVHPGPRSRSCIGPRNVSCDLASARAAIATPFGLCLTTA